jgi:hypothetical protein
MMQRVGFRRPLQIEVDGKVGARSAHAGRERPQHDPVQIERRALCRR